MSEKTELFRLVISEIADDKVDTNVTNEDGEKIATKIAVEAVADGSASIIEETLTRTFLQHDELFNIFRRAITAAMMRKLSGDTDEGEEVKG